MAMTAWSWNTWTTAGPPESGRPSSEALGTFTRRFTRSPWLIRFDTADEPAASKETATVPSGRAPANVTGPERRPTSSGATNVAPTTNWPARGTPSATVPTRTAGSVPAVDGRHVGKLGGRVRLASAWAPVKESGRESWG